MCSYLTLIARTIADLGLAIGVVLVSSAILMQGNLPLPCSSAASSQSVVVVAVTTGVVEVELDAMSHLLSRNFDWLQQQRGLHTGFKAGLKGWMIGGIYYGMIYDRR